MNTNGQRPQGDPSRSNSGDLNKPQISGSTPSHPTGLPPKNDLGTEPHSTESWQSTSTTGKTTDAQFEKTRTENQKDYQREGKSFENKAREFGDKAKGTFEDLKQSELYQYAQGNQEQVLTYILLALGIILLFTYNFHLIGGLLIGGVAGYHFAPEIIYYIKNIGQIFRGQNRLRYIVLTALLVGLFIAAPGIFVGAAIMAAFTQVFSKREYGDNEPKQWKDDRSREDRSRENRNNDRNRPKQ